MDKQTENYIILKPLAERFNKVASEITDDDIKSLILSSIHKQVDTIDFSSLIDEMITEYIEENAEEILNLFESSLKNKFK